MTQTPPDTQNVASETALHPKDPHTQMPLHAGVVAEPWGPWLFSCGAGMGGAVGPAGQTPKQ